MIKIEEVVTGLYGAWRLFLRDRRAVALFDDSYAGVIKSFFCAVIVLPGYVLILAFTPSVVKSDASTFRIVAVNLIAYVLSWVAWPLLMAYVAPAIDRSKEYCRYVVAANWAGGPQIAIHLLVLLVAVTGVVTKDVVELLTLIAVLIVLVYHLFILRVVLRVSLFLGIGLLVADVMLSQIILQIRAGLLH